MCQVTKDSGEQSEHHGRHSDNSLFWSRQTPDVVECFRERVMDRDDGRVYEIHGFGVYGHGANSSRFYFEGKYHQVEPPAAGATNAVSTQ